jgi:hypothetical protein
MVLSLFSIKMLFEGVFWCTECLIIDFCIKSGALFGFLKKK